MTDMITWTDGYGIYLGHLIGDHPAIIAYTVRGDHHWPQTFTALAGGRELGTGFASADEAKADCEFNAVVRGPGPHAVSCTACGEIRLRAVSHVCKPVTHTRTNVRPERCNMISIRILSPSGQSVYTATLDTIKPTPGMIRRFFWAGLRALVEAHNQTPPALSTRLEIEVQRLTSDIGEISIKNVKTKNWED